MNLVSLLSNENPRKYELNDNVMHVFSHPLISVIKLIFTQHAFHLKYIKELFHVLKICQ
jgi:hypothetical protein